MVRDAILIRNERLKLLAGFANAIGLALIGVGALAPMVASLSRPLPDAVRPSPHPLAWVAFLAAGLACHGLAHYVLGRLAKG